MGSPHRPEDRQKNMLYARYSWRGAVQEPAEPLPTIGVRNGYRRGSAFVLSDAHTFGTALINEVPLRFPEQPQPVLGPLSGLEVLHYTGIQGVPAPGITAACRSSLSRRADQHPLHRPHHRPLPLRSRWRTT